MDLYVYYSIIIFGIIICSLYFYIIWVRACEKSNNKKKQKYKHILNPLMDTFITTLIDSGEMNLTEKNSLLKHLSKNKLKNAVVEDRMIYYLENLKGDFTSQLINFCVETGMIDKKIKELVKNNSYAKALACKKLGELRSKKAVPYLLKEVSSSSMDVTYNALLALAKIGDHEGFLKAFENINNATLLSERSLIEVVDSFEGDKFLIYSQMIDYDNEFVSCIFIKSAGRYKNAALGEQIAKFLKCDSKERILSAIKALSGMHDIRYIHQISELLDHETWEIRAVAAKALGYFHDVSIIDKLINALSDKQWFVRFNAAGALLTLDTHLTYLSKVFKGTDKFAKDILISAMENNYLQQGGDLKNE